MRFFVFLILVFSFTLSANSAQKYDYKKYWSHENLKTKTASFTLYIKDSPAMHIGNIATMTVSNDNKDSSETILNLLKKSIGTEAWTHDQFDGLDIHETYDANSGTLFRLAINKKTNEYSLGTIKVRYLMPSYAELHVMQVEKLTKKKSKTTAEFLYDLLFSKAYADSIADRVQQYLAQTAQLSLATTNNTIDNSSIRISNSLDGFSRTVDTSTTRLNSTLSNATERLDATADKITGVVSKKNVAELAAVATLSSTVTAALTTFMLAGTYDMAKKVFYEAMGEFTPAEKKVKIENFEASMKTFKQLSPEIEKLDQKLTSVAALMGDLTKDSTEASLIRIEQDIVRQKQRLVEGTAGCVECLTEEVTLKIKELESMKDVIKKAGVDVQKKKGQVCLEVDTLYSDWRAAELQLTNARRYIVQDARVYMGLVNANAKVSLKMQEQRMQNNSCLGDTISDLAKISDSDKQSCDQDPESSRAVCRNLRSYRQDKKNCEEGASQLITEDLKASLKESATNFNSDLTTLSSALVKLDCSELSNGSCLKPGVFTETSQAFKKQFSDFTQQCPDRLFAKSLEKQKAASKPTQVVVASVEPKKEEKSLFRRFFESFKLKPDEAATQAQKQYQTGESYMGGY